MNEAYNNDNNYNSSYNASGCQSAEQNSAQNTGGYYYQNFSQNSYQNGPSPNRYEEPPKKKSGVGKVIAITLGMVLLVGVAAIGGYSAHTIFEKLTQKEATMPEEITPEKDPQKVTVIQPDVQNGESQFSGGVILTDVSNVVAQVMPTVVSITNSTYYTYEDMFSWWGQTTQIPTESSGSGIIIGEEDDKIYIATNYHVIESASDVSIIAGSDNSATIQAYYQGSDSDTDLAVIYIKKSEIPEEVRSEMKIATLGDSSAIRLGDLAIAIGSPVDKSFGNSVTAGTISGLERTVSFVDEETQTTQSMILIQTDAAINPGNSGGALVNGRGEVIGINNSKISHTDVEGMGFAIPMNTAKPILETLINDGRVIRPYIGITGIAVNNYPEFAQQYQILSGVIVISVMEDGPALYAGLQPYDVIMSFDGKSIETFDDLTAAIHEVGIGNSVEIEVLRGYQEGDPQMVTLTIAIAEKNSTARK
ncbi:MAG: trypsin-like peptidase domain-containing protein [Lachnospiraceae bacterium]|nr:trypsin-like peptidase domain-containing protein [Lachnospiraceae bacterium]